MFVGHSSSRGIVIGDTALPNPNAVYGCWREGKVVLETGSFKELLERQKREAETDDKPSAERGSGRLIFGVMGLLLLFCVLVWKLFGFMNFLAVLVFSILGYFPLMVILFARRNHYKTPELHEQFRRCHGCEHAIIKLLSRQRHEVGENWLTMSDLIQSPIYDSECGTVYAGYFLTLACEIGLFLSNLVDIGFFRSVGVILATVILFVILIFLPWNPYKRLQYPAVTKPGKKEYELGMEILREMQKILAH